MKRPEETLCELKGKQHVFIMGSKGIPAAYGGFETFVEKLTEYRRDGRIQYHVACCARDNRRFIYNGAVCFNVPVPRIGHARAIYYDIAALWHCIRYCKAHPEIQRPIFYVLTCRIGPFIQHAKREIQALGGLLYLNPDGNEWNRGKWSAPVQAYWKWSERMMVRCADRIIGDSINIVKYIGGEYARYAPRLSFIPYGSDLACGFTPQDDERFERYLAEKRLRRGEYYLVVSRFVPENSFETILREFMASATKRELVIVATKNPRLYRELNRNLRFSDDPRIRFVGTLYDQTVLKQLRANAVAYLHGHTVGGTNPSLLEALGFSDMTLAFDVCFNREVCQDAAEYWDAQPGTLAALIDRCDAMDEPTRAEYRRRARRRIEDVYNWHAVAEQYEDVFTNERRT